MAVDHSPQDRASGADPSLGELLSATTQDFSQLVRAELDLAKLELKEEATTAAKAGGMIGAAGVLGHLALLLALFAAAWGLATVMPTGVAFLIVAVVVAIVAAVLLAAGRTRMKEATPVAPQTVDTLQEDARWARQLRN
jgi:uncharacterized membrane protein YqjE